VTIVRKVAGTSTAASGHHEPATLATAAAGLAPIADAGEAWRPSTGDLGLKEWPSGCGAQSRWTKE
jgi:hypothetical protein